MTPLLTPTMEQHALAIIAQNELWKWPDTKIVFASEKRVHEFTAIAPKFLYLLIEESQKLGGKVLEWFWKALGACNEKLSDNIESLQLKEFLSAQHSFDALFLGLDPKRVNFQPVADMTGKFFISLGFTFVNLKERGYGLSRHSPSPPLSVVNQETDQLLHQLNKGNVGKREEILMALSFKRDGKSCLLVGQEFVPFDENGLDPALARVIPSILRNKPDTLACIVAFTGANAKDAAILQHLDDVNNVMGMELNAYNSYCKLTWGIEAKEERGEIKYIFRVVSTDPNRYPRTITLKEGDEILLGKGPDGKGLDKGPMPLLCNLRLAIARVLKRSGVADTILKWQNEGGDEEFDDDDSEADDSDDDSEAGNDG